MSPRIAGVDSASRCSGCSLAPRLLALAVAVCCPAAGQAVEPARARAGPLTIEPTLEVELSWTDNLYRSRRHEIDSWILQTTPRVDAWLQRGPGRYGLLYELQDGRYSGTPAGEEDDFTDHRLRGYLHHEFDVHNRLDLFAQRHRTHEERGTGLSEGLPVRPFDSPIEYDHDYLGGEYGYGNRQTRGRLELAAARDAYDYRNFRAYTQYFDYDRDSYRGTLFWNVSGRSSLLLEAGHLQTDYPRARPGEPPLDARELRLLVGAEWEATGRTRGTVMFGSFEREFDAVERDTADGYAWDIQVNYRYKSYSVFDFGTRQVSRETNGLGDYINSHEWTFNWRHRYTRGYRSNLGLLLADDEYGGIDRDDVRLALELTLDRPVRRWLDLGVGYRYEDRESNYSDAFFRDDNFSYRRNALFAFLRMSL